MDEAYTSIKYTKGQQRMDIPGIQTTLDTRHRTKTRQKKHNTENQKDEQHEPHQQTEGEPRCSRRASSFCFL
jgi:hypothetical protein